MAIIKLGCPIDKTSSNYAKLSQHNSLSLTLSTKKLRIRIKTFSRPTKTQLDPIGFLHTMRQYTSNDPITIKLSFLANAIWWIEKLTKMGKEFLSRIQQQWSCQKVTSTEKNQSFLLDALGLSLHPAQPDNINEKVSTTTTIHFQFG